MNDVMLLSEIHPRGVHQFNPLEQAAQWYGLAQVDEIPLLNRSAPEQFVAAIELIRARAEERGATLVIRDWTHLDFTAVPYLPTPSYFLTTAAALRQHFTLCQIAAVRHPLDQWQSLTKLTIMRGCLTLHTFLHGYLRFAQEAVRIGFVRYEDFVAAPARVMQSICADLEVSYDPEFISKWMRYTTITGDMKSVRESRYQTIHPRPRRVVDPALLDAVAQSTDYRQALALLGYEHP